MLTNTWLYLGILGAIIIVALAFYAGRLLWLVKAQKQAQQQALKEQQTKHYQFDTNVLNSVVIIARAMQAEQCDYSEGCWRISVLLDSLKTSSELAQEFPAIFEFYQKIKHMPILEERKKLEKRDRMRLDFERMKIEANLRDDISRDITLLLQYSQERLSFLNNAV